ncbi:hypothetical protein MTBBW1_1940002 [Desulfamplus magnetovallimortis]|uniref:Uncharacterized protein n=1 Tax=Desulfamplus magnetovallimortis TaxID=1246637 RepID=A0A1W1HBA6_9BACT|nr:hypothetical protein MTBBW1_1940002 [Desulfamplus magnetovallimortis]
MYFLFMEENSGNIVHYSSIRATTLKRRPLIIKGIANVAAYGDGLHYFSSSYHLMPVSIPGIIDKLFTLMDETSNC